MDWKYFFGFWSRWILWLALVCGVCFVVCYSLSTSAEPYYSGIGGAIGIAIPTVLQGLFCAIKRRT